MINFFLPSRSAVIEQEGHPRAGLLAPVGREGTAGVHVTPEVAMTYSAIWSGVRVLSETVATLPCLLYRRVGDRGKERATEDPRFSLIHDQPNEFMTAYSFFEIGTAHQVLRGNGYAKIVSSNGKVFALEPRLPQTVQMEQDDNGIFYRVDELREIIDFEDMLHVFGISNDGLQGLSLIQAAQQSMGTAIATEEHAGAFFGNSARPSGLLSVPGRLTPENREDLRKEWNNVHKGSDKSATLAIMHGGMEFTPLTINNDEAQFIESRKFSVAEVGRWLRIPSHLLNDLERATFSNIEQLAIEFVKYSLMPWLKRWETQLNRKLLSREERGELFYEFMVDALLRGDTKSRYDSYAVGRQWGWLSTNDIRGFENMNPVDGGDDDYLVPTNMRMLGEPPPEPLQQEFEGNVRQLVVDIFEQGAAIQKDIADGRSAQEAMAVADENLRDKVEGIQKHNAWIREEIQDWPSRQQVMVRASKISWDAIKDAKAYSRKRETKLAVAAAKAYVHRGESFMAWLDDDYLSCDFITERIGSAVENLHLMGEEDVNTNDILEAHLTTGYNKLLSAADGDPDGFVERVETCLVSS